MILNITCGVFLSMYHKIEKSDEKGGQEMEGEERGKGKVKRINMFYIHVPALHSKCNHAWCIAGIC